MSKRKQIVSAGKILQSHNVQYKLGAKALPPNVPTHLDCSGFVRYCYRVADIQIPDGTYYQWQDSKEITSDELQIGDVGFLYNPTTLGKRTNHIGIYVGSGMWMHCNYSRNGITIERTTMFRFLRRFNAMYDVDIAEKNTSRGESNRKNDTSNKDNNGGDEYMKKKVKMEFNGKNIELEMIEENGHKYIKIQDFWKFGFKVSGNDKNVKID